MTNREFRSRKYPATSGFGHLSGSEQKVLCKLLINSGCRMKLTSTNEGNELVFLKISATGLLVNLAKWGINLIHPIDY